MTTKPVFPALGAPMSPAWVHGSPRVEELALPKSLKSCNFTLAKVVIRWMSVKVALMDCEAGTYIKKPARTNLHGGQNFMRGGGRYDETAFCCAPVRECHRNHCGSSSDRRWSGSRAQSHKTLERKLFDFDGRDRPPSWRVARRGHHGPRPPDPPTKRPR
jgi:hypothetical protein